MELYITPLSDPKSKHSKIFTRPQLATLFGGIATIAELNRKFLQDLEQRVQSWGPDSLLGDVFVTFSPYFKMYTQYINNQEKALDVLDQFKGHAKFVKFCQSARKDPRCKGW